MSLAISPFDWLLDLISDSPWTYAVVFGSVAVDAVLPILPGETAVITASISASKGSLSIWLIGAVSLASGLAGDVASYWIGRMLGARVYFRFLGSERDRERYDWAQQVLERYGAWIIPAARFVPGGRTTITLASGTVKLGWRSFFTADLTGVLIWAVLYTALGYFGGELFREKSWAAFLVSLGVVLLIALIGYGWYRLERNHT